MNVERRPNGTSAGCAVVVSREADAADTVLGDLSALGYEAILADLDGARPLPRAALIVVVAAGPLTEWADLASYPSVVEAKRGPSIWVVESDNVSGLDRYQALFDDFLVRPYARQELDARLRRVTGSTEHPEMVRGGVVELNPALYSARVDGRPLELTFMEYELLRFLVAQPHRVHSREAILRAVWGYDYYGGIRTVDVHVRRLRAKLGQEHARLIHTVRNVGYGFDATATAAPDEWAAGDRDDG